MQEKTYLFSNKKGVYYTMNKPRWHRLLRLTHQRVKSFQTWDYGTHHIDEARDLWEMVKRFPLEARRQIFMIEEYKGAYTDTDDRAWLFLLPLQCRYMDKDEYLETLIDGDPLLEVAYFTRVTELYRYYSILKGKFKL